LIDAAPKGENREEDDMSGALEGSCDHPDE
jgi:hypothetical protein